MNVDLLIDSIVRQTTVLIAQIAAATTIWAITVAGKTVYYSDGTSGHGELKRVPVAGGNSDDDRS